MARIFAAGAEAQSLDVWNDFEGTIFSSAGLDMGGDYCVKLPFIDSYLTKFLEESKSSLYFAFKFRFYTATANGIINFKDSAGTVILSIYIDSNLNIVIKRGGRSSTILATGSIAFSKDVTYQLEVFYSPLNTGGQVIVKVDGVEDINYTGDTTNGLENIKAFAFGYGFNNNAYAYCYIDDIIVDDSNWIGIGHTLVLGAITGAGSSEQWNSSTGASNYTTIDEVPYSDTDYNSTNTVNDLDLHALDVTCLDGLDVESIHGVYINIRSAYEGAPTPTGVQAALKAGVTTATSATIIPALSFITNQKVWEINPNTSASFVTGDFATGLEIGYKAV